MAYKDVPACLELVDDTAESGMIFAGIWLAPLVIYEIARMGINTVRVHQGLPPLVEDIQTTKIATEAAETLLAWFSISGLVKLMTYGAKQEYKYDRN